MVKKLKELADAGTENPLAATVKDSAQQIWLAGLGAFAKAQEEGTRLFDALVKEGEALQAKTRKAAEDRVVAFTGKATDTWDKLEKVFEDRVARAIHSLGVPTKQDVQALSRRVAELTEAVQKLTEADEAAAKRRGVATTK